MSTYRLTPIEELEQGRLWSGSKISPKEVWVNAQDERDAREQVSLATAAANNGNGRVRITDADTESSPWKNRKLVRCVIDDTVKLARGVIRIRGGTILPITDFEAADALAE